MDVKAAVTRKLGPLPVWGWAIVVVGAVVAVRIVRGKSALPSGGSSPGGTVVGASSGIPAAGESIIGQLSASDLETLRSALGPGPVGATGAAGKTGATGKTGPIGPAGKPSTPPSMPPRTVNYAGQRDPFGTVYPTYVHTAAEANAWIQRALANGAHLPKGMTTQQALVH